MNWMDDVAARVRRRNQIFFARDSALLAPLSMQLAAAGRRVSVLWALELAGEIARDLARRLPEGMRAVAAVEAARCWAEGTLKMPAARRAILDCHAAARGVASPADAARLHAVAQGCSAVHAQGHAIGLPIYELTAIVRERGLEAACLPVESRAADYAVRLANCRLQALDESRPWAAFLN